MFHAADLKQVNSILIQLHITMQNIFWRTLHINCRCQFSMLKINKNFVLYEFWILRTGVCKVSVDAIKNVF